MVVVVEVAVIVVIVEVEIVVTVNVLQHLVCFTCFYCVDPRSFHESRLSFSYLSGFPLAELSRALRHQLSRWCTVHDSPPLVSPRQTPVRILLRITIHAPCRRASRAEQRRIKRTKRGTQKKEAETGYAVSTIESSERGSIFRGGCNDAKVFRCAERQNGNGNGNGNGEDCREKGGRGSRRRTNTATKREKKERPGGKRKGKRRGAERKRRRRTRGGQGGKVRRD